MKEIAEALSVKKLWQRIVSLAQIMKAESLSVQTRSDKIVVRMRIANKMQDTVTLKRSTANSLYVAARYYCDLPFKQNTEIEKGYTNIFSHNKTEVFPVWFTSTQTGFSIDIFPNSVDEMQSKVQELGFSGKEQSGKTFAYYQLIEACASRFNVASIERVTEYIVDKVNQISWLQRPEKDLQSIVVNHDVLAISDPRNSIDSLLLRIAREKTVILETGIGIMPFIKKLLQKGKTLKDISSACSYNLVSFVFESLEPTDRVQYKLSASDLSTLEEYISIEELKYLLELSGESHKNITRFNDVSWVQKVDTQTSLLQHFGLFKRKTLAVSASKKYLRALVDINYELEQAVKHNKTLIELEQSIKHAQKQSLLHTALIPAFRKEIDITELIAMLRA